MLRPFRGELTILDSRGGGGEMGEDGGGFGGSRGSDFGRASPMERKPAASGSTGGYSGDLDDDIPF